MKTLLVFSYYYPPQKGIGGKRIFRLLSRLPQHGWQAIVLTTPWPVSGDRDLAQPIYADNLSVDRGYVPEWFWNLYHANNGSESNPKALAKLLGNLGRILGYPIDGKVWLAPFAYRRAVEIAQTHRIDAVLSTSAPYSSHLAAIPLAKKLGVPFYADLRDPWTFNFLWRNRPPLQKRLDAFAERFVLANSAKVFLAARSTEEKYRLLYPEFSERFQTIYSGFEPHPTPLHSRIGMERGDRAAVGEVHEDGEGRGEVRCMHFGRFYGVRRTTHMLSAIKALLQEKRLTPEQFQFVTLGEMQPADREQLRAEGLSEFFPVSPMMPYEKGLSMLEGADVLFLCDYDLEPYFVPGKLFDYLRVGRPIFALSANPEVRELIERTQTGKALHPEDTEGQLALWREIFEKGSTAALGFSPRDTGILSSDTAAKQLADALRHPPT